MSERVAVRDAPRTQLTVWHSLGENGRPACRQGTKPECSYRIEKREALPDDITQCAYCSGEHTPQNALPSNTLAHKLEHADPEEVLGR